jgi:hypothetical protein
MTKSIPDKAEVALVAKTASSIPSSHRMHQDALRTAVEALYRSLGGEPTSEKRPLGDNHGSDKDEISNLTPEEEVLLLHLLE